MSMAPILEALGKAMELVKKLRSLGLAIKYLDLGGGLGITYHKENPPLPKKCAGPE